MTDARTQKHGRRRCAARPRAFTLMELIVAISVVSLVMLLVNQIFFDATRGMSLGLQTAEAISASRMFAATIQDDAAHMVGPTSTTADPGGFLVIINKQIEQPIMLPGGTVVNDDARPDLKATVRSDQLLFIRRRGDLQPIAPASESSYYRAATDMPYVRIWYGHLHQTNPTGQDSWISSTSIADPDTNLGVTYANHLTLGRSALFLSESTPTGIYANGITFDAVVNGFTPGNGNPSTGIPDPQLLYMGLTDVANKSLSDILVDLGDASAIGYANTALSYTFARKRMRFNPTPNRHTFRAWHIAQMHANFMPRVSDFEVSFALADDLLDTSVTPNKIDWHDFSDATPPNWAGAGNRWDAVQTAPYAGPLAAPFGGADALHADAVYVFGHGTGAEWPALIRIRYRIHDQAGRLFEPTDAAENPWAEINEQPPGKWFEVIIPVNTGS